MKRYPIRYLMFFLPFMVAFAIELFVLPIDYFTFRVWESLIVKKSFGILNGPFYPNMKIKKMEEGELAYYTPCAIKKDVTWTIDKYGYRKANISDLKYPIAIIGDSNIAGSGLTQEDLLSEVLQKKLGIAVYPLSPERINSVFAHAAFSRSVPEIIILASVERGIPSGLTRLERKGFKKPSSWSELLSKVQLNDIVQRFAVLLDRAFKSNMLNYLRARINNSGPSLQGELDTSQCSLLYLHHGQSVKREETGNRYKQSITIIKGYSDFFQERGIRFIFLPIPNKSTIYYEHMDIQRPGFLSRLVQGLREQNVEVIDTERAFHDFYQKTRVPIFQEDDTHWNATGVKITAELLEKQIKEQSAPISTSR